VDEHSVRIAIASLVDAGGEPLFPVVSEVLLAQGWIAIVLGERREQRERLARLHAHLTRIYPQHEIEIRSSASVYRGGEGIGDGRHVIAVLGGKGGVGKSTVSVSLALTLSAMGYHVGILDGDLNGPDIPHMLGVHPGERKRRDWRLGAIRPPADRRRPYERWGLEVMSVGFVVSERAPLSATGHWLVSGLLRNLLFDIAWKSDVIVIDAPPGTGEEIQVMVRELPISGALFVTTPQDLAQMDAQRTLSQLKEHGVPVIGMVQNMASLTCPHCSNPIDLYATSRRLEDAGVPILSRIPFDTRLSFSADRGVPLVLGDPTGPVALEFGYMGLAVRRWLQERPGGLAMSRPNASSGPGTIRA
jgi:ATP-binding protein involved in chromosome partitioning